MSRRLTIFTFGGLVLFLMLAVPAMAIDTESESLQFLEPDAPLVMAMDIDEVMAYARGVGRDWRPADTAHFFEALDNFSYIITEEAYKPDVLTFFSRLEGVQAIQMPIEGNFPLMVFSATNERDLNTIALYTYAYIVEERLNASFTELHNAIYAYYNRAIEDPETGEITYPYTYPATIDDLVEFGYLESIPINPYTGEPIRIIGENDEGEPGDVFYSPQPGGPDSDGYLGYDARSYRIFGVNFRDGWNYTFEVYDNFADRLRSFGRNYDLETMGFNVETDGAWNYVSRDDAEYAFAYGDTFMLFGGTVDDLKAAVGRYQDNAGFSFSTSEDFDLSDAFYLGQTDFSAAFDGFRQGLMTGLGMGMDSGTEEGPDKVENGDMPDIAGIMERISNSMGTEAIGNINTACWLQDSDIVSRRWVELTGEAEGTYLSSIMTAQPEELMTAQGGPFELIGEVAWANPDDFVHAYLGFIFVTVMPEFQEAFGAEGFNPDEILALFGINDINNLEVGDQLNVLITASTKREGDVYLPGISAVMQSDNTDLAYIAVGVMDTLSLMVPDFPFMQAQYGDENAFTWVCECDKFHITPTIAWTDGWIIKGLWREDVLAIRDAIDAGEMFTPDGMGPANLRVNVNRQELLRGFADIMYSIDEDEIPFVGAFFEIAAQLSNPDERLYIEWVGYDDHVEMTGEFSIDLFENMIPAMTYILKGMRNTGI